METIASTHRQSLDRRQLIGAAGAGIIGLAGIESVSFAFAGAAQAEKSKAGLEPLNRFPRMVQEYYVGQVRAAEKAGLEVKANLKTKAGAEAYVRAVREKISRCFGPWPEKTPLNARVTGVVERDAYNIEKILFESRPGFLVSANLYVPKGSKLPLPGVVGSCGHSVNGKAAEAYQSFAQGLARQGYVTLIFDPIGQGERYQYLDADLKPKLRGTVEEHLLAGNQQFLVGDFFGSWRAWDGIRALDYLLSRPEVDPKHVGITGNSGGGTMTTWLCGVEPRWTMAAPSCFVTTFRRNMENELPADTEQCPPRALSLSLDHDDFLAAMAPKPVIILAKERDFFDVRGAEEAYGRLKRLYALLGAEENIKLFTGPTDHGYSKENREAMYQWFNRVTGVSDAKVEPKLIIEKDETLWCTPKGQVADLKSRTVCSFTKDKSKALGSKRREPDAAELSKAVIETLRLPKQSDNPEYRILRPASGRKYPKPQVSTYAVETEPGVFAIVYRLGEQSHLARPPRMQGPAFLYVSHHSADAELRDDPFIRDLLKTEPDSTVYACDVRGVGESRPNTCGANTFLTPYGCDYFYAIHANMLDRPYVGGKTHDLLTVLNWLKGIGHEKVHLAAMGWGTIPATFAALLAPTVTRVTLNNAPASFAEIAEAEEYGWPLSCLLPGVLERFDLPDCYRVLQAKNLKQVEPRGPGKAR